VPDEISYGALPIRFILNRPDSTCIPSKRRFLSSVKIVYGPLRPCHAFHDRHDFKRPGNSRRIVTISALRSGRFLDFDAGLARRHCSKFRRSGAYDAEGSLLAGLLGCPQDLSLRANPPLAGGIPFPLVQEVSSVSIASLKGRPSDSGLSTPISGTGIGNGQTVPERQD
jgi:hypothetical protein